MLPFLGKSLSRDEGASLYSAHLSWSVLWRQSSVVDRVILPYYALLHLWVEISGSIEWIRLLSVIAFGVSVVLVGHLGNRLGGFWCGVTAATLTASNPLMIDAALDARPYALSALAGTVAVYSLFRWRDGPGNRWFCLFCIASLVALALQIFAILGPLVVLVVMLFGRPSRPRYWRQIVTPLSGTLLLSALYVSVVFGQRSQVAWIPPMSLQTFVADVYGPASGYPRLAKESYFALIMVLIVVGLLRFWRSRDQRGKGQQRTVRENLIATVAWSALPAMVLIAVSFGKPIYVDRYVTASAPGLALALGLWLTQVLDLNDRDRLKRHHQAEGALAGVIVVALFGNLILTASTPLANYPAVAQYLQVQVGHAGEIALPDHSVATSVEYYLDLHHESPRQWPEDRSDLSLMSLDLRETKFAFASAEPNVWVVEDKVNGLHTFLDNLSRRGYALVGTRKFDGLLVVKVAHYQRSDD